MNHIELTQKEKEIIVGCYLGDGGILEYPHNPFNSCFMEIQHSIKQLDYVKYKAQLLNRIVKQPRIGNRTIKGKPYQTAMITIRNNEFLKQLKNCYVDHRKAIETWMLDYITPISLAIWFMDDGDKSMRRRTRKDGSKYEYFAYARISLGILSDTETKLLSDFMKSKYDIENHILKEFNTKQNKYYSRMYIPAKNAYKFFDLIDEFIPECMKYKIDYSGQRNKYNYDDIVRTPNIT